MDVDNWKNGFNHIQLKQRTENGMYSKDSSTLLQGDSLSDSSSLSASLGGCHLAAFLTLPFNETPGVAECRFLWSSLTPSSPIM
jgi:hypothetical protein